MDSHPLEVFISYAHADQALKDELIKHLSPLKRRGLIAHWQDRDISAGAEWAGEIDARLNSADIILLLISPDFLFSDFCYEKEMTRALERHAAGECRVIPVFLRSCDWKGMAFGKLQGVPDDAVPVVSTRWSSQDDAFTRVASAIRQIVERFQSAASPPAASAPVAAAKAESQTVTKGEVEQEFREGAWLDNSGAAVLIADQCFESESVTDKENGRVEVRISPQTGAEEAALRAFQGDRWGNSQQVSFAHGNHGFMASVHSARSQSVAGRPVWTVELDPLNQQRQGMEDFSVGKITPDQIAAARARLLLLGEQPKGHLSEAASFITAASGYGGRQARISGSIFPDLWKRSADDIVKFLRWARLSAVFRLKTTNICQHVLSLELSLKPDDILAVGFTGLRQKPYSNELIMIGVSGHCMLKPPASEETIPEE